MRPGHRRKERIKAIPAYDDEARGDEEVLRVQVVDVRRIKCRSARRSSASEATNKSQRDVGSDAAAHLPAIHHAMLRDG